MKKIYGIYWGSFEVLKIEYLGEHNDLFDIDTEPYLIVAEEKVIQDFCIKFLNSLGLAPALYKNLDNDVFINKRRGDDLKLRL